MCQQAILVANQHKCLLEQHKYIIDQENIRKNMQCRLREKERKQAELTYERNALRNEVCSLKEQLKGYL